MTNYVTLEYTVTERLSKNNLLLVTAEVIDFLDGDAPEIVLTRALLNDEGADIDLFTHAKHCEWKQLAFEWWCSEGRQ